MSTVGIHGSSRAGAAAEAASHSATKDLIDKVAFALYVKEKALPLYEQVFDIEYPLPKLDTLVAHDFDAGEWYYVTFDPQPLSRMELQARWRTGDLSLVAPTPLLLTPSRVICVLRSRSRTRNAMKSRICGACSV